MLAGNTAWDRELYLISLGKNIFSKETKSEKTRGLQSYAPKRSVLWKKENVETSFYNGTFVALK
mgnify:CR=1 FL=1